MGNTMGNMANAIVTGKFEVPLYVDEALGAILFVAVNAYASGDTAPSHFNLKFKDGRPTKSFKYDQFKLAVMMAMPETRGMFHE